MLSRGREAVRVRVQKYEDKQPCEIRKFSVDPQITSLEELRNILVTAFDLKEDFSLSYKSIDDYGRHDFLILLSDWDLDAAFLRAYNMSSSPGSEPCINLKIDVKSQTSSNNSNIKKSDSATDKPLAIGQKFTSNNTENSDIKNMQTGFHGILINQMEKTLNLFSRALNLSEESYAPTRPPLNQDEFHSFLGPVGHVINGTKLRKVVYESGIDPSFRKVVWKHILNVYPDGMSGKERLDYMKKKSAEYFSLRDVWRDCLNKGQVPNTLAYVTNMVKKDVLRTDRHHKFFSGSDDNQNITNLFNILTTYALNHPTVSYCQGMSDIASPLLVVMDNEAHAYVCLCALMKRLYPNFLLDGEAMTLKFTHLTESLQIYDPIFYSYLQSQQADDLLFCYRWLLLEMKREFAFEDALHMLEVLWSSLPQNPPSEELLLKEKEFCPDEEELDINETPISPLIKTPRENAYTKLCAIRRQSSSYSLSSNSKNKVPYRRMNFSLDENISMNTTIYPSLRESKEYQSLDETQINFNKEVSPDELNMDSIRSFLNKENNHVQHNDHSSESKINKLKSLEMLHSNAKNHSNLDPLNQQETTNRKLVKKFSEFNNFSSRPTKIVENTNGHDTEEDKILNDVDKKDITITSRNTNPFLSPSPNCISKPLIPTTTSPSNTSDTSPSESHENCNEDSVDNNTEAVNNETVNKNNSGINTDRKFDDVFIWENPLHFKCFDAKTEKDEIQKSFDSAFTNDKNYENTRKEVQNISQTECPENSSREKKPIETQNQNINRKMLLKDASKSNSKFFSNMSQELENARKNCEILLANKKCTNFQSIATTITNFQKKCDFQSNSAMIQSNNIFSVSNSCEEISESNANKPVALALPPRETFGGGNPFLIFLCLTLLMQHRDVIMRNRMDYNELAMYFDKMVRKHNVHRVLHQARRMYSCYLKDLKINVDM